MKFKITGHRILIKPDPIEKKTASGIVIAKPGNLEKQEMRASETGTVMQVGPTAWTHLDYDSGKWEPWCKVGDHVYIVKYAGKFIYDKETQEEFICCNDEDVLAVIED